MYLGSSAIQSVIGEVPPDMTIISIPQYVDQVTPGALIIVEEICDLNQISAALNKGGKIVSVERAREEIERRTTALFDISFRKDSGAKTNTVISVPFSADRSNPGIKQQRPPIASELIEPQAGKQASPISEAAMFTGPRGRIIASKSTKGGVGKSTTGINVAAFYASRGEKTCLIDLDIGKGNAAAMLRLKGRTGPSVENWHAYDRLSAIRHSSGFYFIPWGNDPGFVAYESEIASLIHKAAHEFAVVVLDYGVNPYLAMTGLEMADIIYLIANQSESMLVEFMETFIQVFPNLINKSELVVNRVTPSGYYKPTEVASKTGFTTFYAIPECLESNKVSEKTGKAFVQIPGSPAGEAFIRMLGGEVKANKKSRLGFLRRQTC